MGVGWGGGEPVSPGAWLEGLSSQKKLCGSLIIMVSKYVKYCVGEKTYSGARTRLTVKTTGCFARPHIFHSPRLQGWGRSERGGSGLALVSCGLSNKLPQTGWLKIIELHFLTVLEARGLTSSYQQRQAFSRGPEESVWLSAFLGLRLHHLYLCLHDHLAALLSTVCPL